MGRLLGKLALGVAASVAGALVINEVIEIIKYNNLEKAMIEAQNKMPVETGEPAKS
jgi:hypothetical protein